ncbi:MAG: tRNA pseudouridine(55) synthase TruB [Deltaproteobacteria bacterium]|jgi:tRNA pseudouridine55 synthase|nr:tRNA pseudouridine(55) synthase TruB [Deltaproteobacteria bacterium]
MKNRKGVDGILLVDKPVDMSSASAVARIKRVLGGVKVGHLGTLDPLASGLLPLCLGMGTKAAPWLNSATKTYTGVIRLGVLTDTLDRGGKVVATSPVPALADIDLDELADRFTGSLSQVPPAYSAIKKDGVPMYKRARRGEEVELEPREVTIFELKLTVRDASALEFSVHCSKGTYVRALARDLGEAIGCGAHMESLVRTAFGRFRIEDAASMENLEDSDGSELEAAVLPLSKALAHLESLEVDDRGASGLRQGRQDVLGVLRRPQDGESAMVTRAGRLVAVISEQSGLWKLERVFAG